MVKVEVEVMVKVEVMTSIKHTTRKDGHQPVEVWLLAQAHGCNALDAFDLQSAWIRSHALSSRHVAFVLNATVALA